MPTQRASGRPPRRVRHAAPKVPYRPPKKTSGLTASWTSSATSSRRTSPTTIVWSPAACSSTNEHSKCAIASSSSGQACSPGRHRTPSKRSMPRRGEASAERLLAVREHIDGEGPLRPDPWPGAGGRSGTERDQRRRQRHRSERVASHSVRPLARHHYHPGREPTEHGAESIRIDLSPQPVSHRRGVVGRRARAPPDR